jgi:hypothetical protein
VRMKVTARPQDSEGTPVGKATNITVRLTR